MEKWRGGGKTSLGEWGTKVGDDGGKAKIEQVREFGEGVGHRGRKKENKKPRVFWGLLGRKRGQGGESWGKEKTIIYGARWV